MIKPKLKSLEKQRCFCLARVSVCQGVELRSVSVVNQMGEFVNEDSVENPIRNGTEPIAQTDGPSLRGA